MKKLKSFIIIISLGWSVSVFGQFNTLSPTPKETHNQRAETTENQRKTKEVNSQQLIAKKSFFQKIFTSEKSKLKKENDSLKRLLNEYKNEKLDFKRIEDSIIINISKKLLLSKLQKKENSENQAKSIKFAMPLRKNLEVTSPFGMRLHPVFGEEKMHNGIDLRANNEFVYSVLEGEITNAGWDTLGGLFVKVKHTEKLETTYCHLSEIYYQKGDKVKAGFIIGKSGNTGVSTAPHLHFAVKEDEKYINPLPFLRDLQLLNYKN